MGDYDPDAVPLMRAFPYITQEGYNIFFWFVSSLIGNWDLPKLTTDAIPRTWLVYSAILDQGVLLLAGIQW